MKSPKFVGWAAVSSGPQAGDDKASLPDQIYANLCAARQHGGKMLCQFVIDGKSRSITLFDDAVKLVSGVVLKNSFENVEDDRLLREIESHMRDVLENNERVPVYAELKKLIDDSAFDVLAFRNLGRIGRDAALSMTVLRLCHNANIITYATASPPATLDSTANYHSALIDAITAVGYENEIKEITRRHETGMIRRIERGFFASSTPWGWHEIRNERGKITGYEIDSEAATIIRSIVQMYVRESQSMPAIAEILNSRGYTTAEGNKWTREGVRHVIRRIQRYAGINELNKTSRVNSGRPYIRTPGKWPAIITQDDADAVERERKSRHPHRRTIAHTKRYSRVVFCYQCGKLMGSHESATRYTNKHGEIKFAKYARFRCTEHTSISAKKITVYLHDMIEQMRRMVRERGTEGEQEEIIDTTEDEIAAINAMIERAKSGIARADNDYYILGKITEERHRAITKAANDRIEQLLGAITELNDKQRQIEHAEQRNERIEEIINRGHEMIEHPNVGVSNAWIRKHFAIYVDDCEVHSVVAL